MDFEIVGIFNRSVTIELQNDLPYQTTTCHTVYVNGQERLTSNKNVISFDGLLPDHEYEIAVADDISDAGSSNQICRKTVRTKKESVLLNVKTFGAAGDGIQNDQTYLQAAIASCPANGTVYIPKGQYLTGPLFLKSHITIWLDQDAELLGLPDRKDYPILPGMTRCTDTEQGEYNLSSWEGNPLDSFASLITGIEVEDVDLIGPGILNGNAKEGDWWQDPKKRRIAWRPNILFFNHCKNIRVQNLTVCNSPCWAIHPYYSEQLAFMNLTIQNPYNSPNTDGFDPESCKDVLLLGTDISVGDDCVAIKSGKYYMAQFHYKRTEGIVIRNCHFERGHGSVTLGSEVACGVQDVTVTQCIFSKTDRGIRIKTRRGRGERSLIDRLLVSKVQMEDVHMPFTVNMFYFCDPDGHSPYVQNQELMPVDEMTPRIGTLIIQDVNCTGVDASFACIYGLPEMPVERIELKQITASYLPESERKPACPIMMDNFD